MKNWLKVSSAAVGIAMIAAPAFGHQPGHRRSPPAVHRAHPSASIVTPASGERRWLAGDHHIHSQFSADYTENAADPAQPPTPVLGADGRYPIPTNAEMAKTHGLAWMVSTDHGGPNHSKIDHDLAYPELTRSRLLVPEVLQFYGMEFDTPAGDHSSLIVPNTRDEREALHGIEHGFSKRDTWPRDPSRDTEPRMIDALTHMKALKSPPIVIANHPSRSATGVGAWGAYTPQEFRNWNDTAPNVAIGMEGAPGHQASALRADGSSNRLGVRGGYGKSPTLGGFDQMTARLGGFWDAMLGEGRGWWITSTSDSHHNWRDGGDDFWPGEYSKTYVLATRDHADILEGLRGGRVFVTTGDLISELDLTVRTIGGHEAMIGGEVRGKPGEAVEVKIRVRDPAGANHAGRRPEVRRIDLIVGRVTGPAADRSADTNPTTRVEQRFTPETWVRDGEYIVVTHTLPRLDASLYLRVRGTSTDELEPVADVAGEDPWADLWFYSNPVFITKL